MSDNIPPLDIQIEILTRLPVKSLIQFRSVSKTWKSIIDTSDFIAAHQHHTHHHRLLVYCNRPAEDDPKYVSFADNHSFPQHKVSLTHVPLLVDKLKYLSVDNIVGSSRGLFCLYGYAPNKPAGGSIPIAVIWNPCIRRVVPVLVPKAPSKKIFSKVLGFGVCPVTNDPKIIKIRYIRYVHDVERISHIPSQVEVFTLSTGVWRKPYNNLPPKSVLLYKFAVDVDGFLYWLAEDKIVMDDGGYARSNVIISFDLTSEEFRQVNLPHSLAHRCYNNNISIFKLKESLVLSQVDNHVNNVWLMEGTGLAKSFSKLYTVNVDAWVRGFRRSGEPIIEVSELMSDKVHWVFKLAAYDPYSKCINCFWTSGRSATFKVYPYMETLLLLDQTNLAVYNEMESIRFIDDLVL
ncbi:hypothetical protein QVD17_14852 [Tagetes erecta]|uniref:F-box domain-containing protein n=1 Tax=Tagetes erecta TaxID=13708 RepID=A0AAD8NY67_TARER|nr:hypothetical protein QVD17_14852 [Tagetes erecta]